MRIFDNLPHIDFMKYKAHALSISWGIIVLCLLAAQPWKGSHSRVKLGMQFVGGIDMQVRYRGDITQGQVRDALIKGGVQDAAVVHYEAPQGYKDYSIKVKARKDLDAKNTDVQNKQIRTALRTLDPGYATDKRPDINMDAITPLAERWAKANPLKKEGDEFTVRRAYDEIINKISKVRTDKAPLLSYDQLPKDVPQVLLSQIKAEYRIGNLAELKNESFSPSISGEWTRKTLSAVGWALGAILIYVMFRFTWSFAVGGIVSLIHDILMAVGLFTLFGFEYSVPVVASFLILIGYSMADTIVVFDRIRENSHKPEYRRASITQLVNDSINQTLSRTILTSLSVLFVAVCLFVWGGPALRDLSFPLVIGVITGTYSSVYIASPVVVIWEKYFPHKQDNLKQKHA